ncbi:MAG TPA: sugar ABC transporter permease [Candidatus Methylomirabilis sp.]|nr:sugar ABC transporter permease [Candidatus Methylomirabilis sp.]
MKDRGTAFAMISPTVAIIVLVFVYPLLVSLWTSFHYRVLSQPSLTRFYGFGNYRWLLQEPRFWDAFGRSMVFLAATVAVSIAVGMLVALLLDHYLSRLRWLKALYLVPMVVTPVVVGIQWRFLLNAQFGVLTWIFRALHLPIGGEWLTTSFGAMFWVIVVDVWYYTPTVILLFGAGLESIPNEIRDAARVDGATAWQRTRLIFIPMLKPVLGVILLIRTIGGLRAFDTIVVITDGGPGRATEVVNLLAYRYGLQYFDVGKASAIGWVMLVVALGLTVLYMRFLRVTASAA